MGRRRRALSATNWLLTAALPPLAGATIVAGARWGDQYRGYEMVFGVAAGLLLGAVALAGHLNCGRRTGFSLQQVWLPSQRNAAWHWIARARLVEGLSGALSGLVITVLTYLVLQNEEKVGDFNGLIGLLGLGISLVLAFCMRPRHRTACAMAGACLLVMSTLLLPCMCQPRRWWSLAYCAPSADRCMGTRWLPWPCRSSIEILRPACCGTSTSSRKSCGSGLGG